MLGINLELRGPCKWRPFLIALKPVNIRQIATSLTKPNRIQFNDPPGTGMKAIYVHAMTARDARSHSIAVSIGAYCGAILPETIGRSI